MSCPFEPQGRSDVLHVIHMGLFLWDSLQHEVQTVTNLELYLSVSLQL